MGTIFFMGTRTITVGQNNIQAPLEKVNVAQNVIALTVNVDWGEEQIPKMLEILEKDQAKATFFLTGRWADKNSELVKEIAAKGHEIENHGYSHPHPDQLSVEGNNQEIMKTEKIIERTIGKKTTFYAPPYGEKGESGVRAASEAGYTTVLWTLDTVDWQPASNVDLIVQRVVNPKTRFGVKPEKKGAIVLMHPKPNTVLALPIILEKLKQEGFSFVTMEELLSLKIDN
nr:polysaccharide deacetylase family protein [Syntrophobotulus glycolicus]